MKSSWGKSSFDYRIQRSYCCILLTKFADPVFFRFGSASLESTCVQACELVERRDIDIAVSASRLSRTPYTIVRQGELVVVSQPPHPTTVAHRQPKVQHAILEVSSGRLRKMELFRSCSYQNIRPLTSICDRKDSSLATVSMTARRP